MGFHRARWPARGALAAPLAIAVLAVSGAAARAAGSVRVVPVGGAGVRTVDLAQLKPDVHDVSYTAVATPGGKPKTVTVRSGYSLPELFQALQIPSSSFGSVEIAAPAGPPVVLNSAQATNQFAYHHGPPVVWVNASGAQLLVPNTPSGRTNAGETFSGPAGTITIVLHRGPLVYVGISGSPIRAVVGRPVGFASKVFGAASGPLRYQWTFGDGTGASPAAPIHAYTATGTYNVYLQVSGSQDSVGASSVIEIIVGNPARATSGRGGGAGGSGTAANGGVRTRGAGTRQGTGTAHTSAPKRSPAHRTPAHRTPKPPRPVGPLVSGIAISYGQQAAPATPAGAGGAQAARSRKLTPRATGLGEGLGIVLGALAMLLGGALLEWIAAPRPRFATSRSR